MNIDDNFVNGWYIEKNPMWPGHGLAIEIKEILYRGQSKYQDICVFDSKVFGKVLLLDGVVQFTESDEFSYQEMITHLPLCGLQNDPKSVLIIGGGDGGVAREVAKYKSIEIIDQAEIDGLVPEISRKYFPNLACGFDDSRHNLHITDGVTLIETCQKDYYDAVIVDCSDPIGPASALFEKPFFEKIYRILKPGGVLCTQCESIWLNMNTIIELAHIHLDIFGKSKGTVNYAYTTVPTYPSGQIGFMISSKPGSNDNDFKTPKRYPDGDLRYYNHDVHRAAHVLPDFATTLLTDYLKN